MRKTKEPLSVADHHRCAAGACVTAISLAFLCNLPGCGGVARADDLQKALALEQRIVDARLAIKTGEVKVLPVLPGAKYQAEVHILFDYRGPRRLRFDQTLPPPAETVFRHGGRDSKDSEVVRIVSNGGRSVSRTVIDGERYLHYRPDEFDPPQKPIAASSRDFENRTDEFIFDPLTIGMTNKAFVHMYLGDIHEYLLRKDRRRTTVTEEMLNEQRVHKIEYLRKDGLKVRLWMCPDQGDSLVRIETTADLGEVSLVVTSDIQQEHFPAAGVWFPKLIRIARRRGGEIPPVETIRIEGSRFNEEIDPVVFSLAGMDVRPGTPVLEHPEDGYRIWDGSRLVERPARDRQAGAIDTGAPPLWLTIGLGCLGLAIVCLFLYWRGRVSA